MYVCQPLHLLGHKHSVSALSFGNKTEPLLLCSASRECVIVWNLAECAQKEQEGRVLATYLPQGQRGTAGNWPWSWPWSWALLSNWWDAGSLVQLGKNQ